VTFITLPIVGVLSIAVNVPVYLPICLSAKAKVTHILKATHQMSAQMWYSHWYSICRKWLPGDQCEVWCLWLPCLEMSRCKEELC